MEEERANSLNRTKCPSMLDFYAPLLSIRRPSGCTNNSQPNLQDTGHSIPFCWEQAPGRPKDSQKSPETDTPRLRLPPGRLHPHKQVSSNQDLHDLDRDDGCHGDADDDYDDIFSNAMDVFSLTEAIDIAEKAEQSNGLDGFDVENNDSISPSYIIERFLPDAIALAASSVMNISRNLSKKLPYVCKNPEACVSEAVRSSYSLPKSCGLDKFLPWRMKQRLCGIKSPVRQVYSANVQVKPQSRVKNKRSIVRPFGDHVKKHSGCISYST